MSYICLAFIRRGGEVWINSPGDDIYWNDYSYAQVSNQLQATKVSFASDDHSAITTGTTDVFISKWGPSPLFRHSKNDCPYDVTNLHYYAPVTISGPSLICSSGAQFTVENPSGATVSWTCSSNISFDHQTGNPKTFTANGTGIGTIQAILIPTCGNNITLPAKTVWVGEPHELELYCEGRGNLYTYSFYVTPFYDGDSIVWGTVPATAELTDLGYGYATIAFDEPGIYDIWAYVTNECGDGTPAYITDFYVYELLMSPNPASTEVEITISAGLEEGSKSANWSSDDEYTVTVLDIYGTVKIQRKYSGSKFTIPVSSLKDGSYIVKINSKKINSSKQLIVKH